MKDVEQRKLHLDVSDEDLAKTKNEWIAPNPMAERGYVKIYIDHVQQAHLGADLDIFNGGSRWRSDKRLALITHKRQEEEIAEIYISFFLRGYQLEYLDGVFYGV